MKTTHMIISCMLLFLAITACKKKTTETVNTQETTQETTVNSEKLQNYKQFLNKLDTTILLSASKAGTEFMEQFKDTNVETNDSAYSLFNDFHHLLTVPQQNIMDKDNDAYMQLFLGVDGKPSQKVKEHYTELQKSGFFLGTVEGYTYIAAAPEFQRKYFFEKLSPAMQVYFAQTQKETKEGTADDGGLLVEPKILAERLLFWDNFATQYPNFRWKTLVGYEIQANRGTLLFGMDNTPAFDYETKNLDAAYRVAYRFLIDQHGIAKIGKLFTEYFEILSKTNMKDSPQAQAYREKYQ